MRKKVQENSRILQENRVPGALPIRTTGRISPSKLYKLIQYGDEEILERNDRFLQKSRGEESVSNEKVRGHKWPWVDSLYAQVPLRLTWSLIPTWEWALKSEVLYNIVILQVDVVRQISGPDGQVAQTPHDAPWPASSPESCALWIDTWLGAGRGVGDRVRLSMVTTRAHEPGLSEFFMVQCNTRSMSNWEQTHSQSSSNRKYRLFGMVGKQGGEQEGD